MVLNLGVAVTTIHPPSTQINHHWKVICMDNASGEILPSSPWTCCSENCSLPAWGVENQWQCDGVPGEMCRCTSGPICLPCVLLKTSSMDLMVLNGIKWSQGIDKPYIYIYISLSLCNNSNSVELGLRLRQVLLLFMISPIWAVQLPCTLLLSLSSSMSFHIVARDRAGKKTISRCWQYIRSDEVVICNSLQSEWRIFGQFKQSMLSCESCCMRLILKSRCLAEQSAYTLFPYKLSRTLRSTHALKCLA